MNPVREALRAARLERKERQAALVPQAWRDDAIAVHAALVREHYDAWLGQGPSQHIVAVRSVKADEKPRIEGIANTATRHTSRFPDVRHSGSHITVEIKEGRAMYELERHIARFGDEGSLLILNGRGFREIGDRTGKPVAALGYDDNTTTHKASHEAV